LKGEEDEVKTAGHKEEIVDVYGSEEVGSKVGCFTGGYVGMVP
jgi:hypothetical protein